MSTGLPTTSLHRVRRALRRYGVRGSARQAAGLMRSAPARRRAQRADRAFDERLGVETSGIVRLHELAFACDTKELGSRYQASSPASFTRVMGQLELGDRELTFIDVGAGKGRALLMASRLPFRRIVGVEFSPELTEVGQRNVEAWRQRNPDCADIELVCQDATTFAFPDEPLLVYMYNPFEAPVMRKVLGNLRASVQRSPRRVLLVLVDRTIELEAVTDSGFASASPPELYLPTWT
jgi:SAM-dependent methyltransferase